MKEWFDLLQKWQTLAASLVAIIAALIAWYNTTRTLKANAALEVQRRSQKHAALRSVLPLSLSELSGYCASNVRALEDLWGECAEGKLPEALTEKPVFPEVPHETVKSFADFIEYSDKLDTSLFRSILARLQVSRARTREIENWIHKPNEETVILEANIEDYIIDWATIYAEVALVYDYARRKTELIPSDVSWANVRSALRNLRIWDHDIEAIHATVDRREAAGVTP